ncbi:YceI family protein [Mucilaginibacter boryungensis]|uniref:YceI family protein n=1 Tax=Mucilaginibacter boryungensis TaxID=768480 RepID=A0ABR9XMD2_9SPHI|nr:YceI family protein [Mucilaginibacter boryungensis]MBE9668522.1 YceI family protein [Mucilaginibacter boryungensis]
MNHFHKKTVFALVFAAIITGVTSQQLPAQTFRLTPEKDATIKVLGSSNVHDWTLTSSAMESQGEFKIDENQLHSIAAFTFSVNAKSLKSEHESMDSRTYKTMKADQYPKVTYKLASATINPAGKNKYQVKATGDLTIAGVTQTIIMNITATVNPDNTITVTGSENLKLTDYKIEPPSFMLGAMKVKNDLTIQFNLTYKNNQLLTKNL